MLEFTAIPPQVKKIPEFPCFMRHLQSHRLVLFVSESIGIQINEALDDQRVLNDALDCMHENWIPVGGTLKITI